MTNTFGTLLNFFGVAANAVPKSVIDQALNRKSDGNVYEQRFIVAGASIVPEKPRQPAGSISDLLQKSQNVKAEFEKLVKDLSGKIQAGKPFIAPDKLECRISDKANSDYAGDFTRVLDPIRATIEINSLAEYNRAARLFCPADNSAVVRFQDGFAKPDNDGGLRRLLVNYRMSNGIIAEIQVRHAGMEKAYKRTESLYKKVRAYRAELEDISKELPQETVVAMNHQLNNWLEKRRTTHDDAARKCGMDKAILEREFFFVNGFPVVKLYHPSNGEYETLIPNIETGRFERDNRLLSVITGEVEGLQISCNIPRDAFIAKCVAMVKCPDVVRLAHSSEIFPVLIA